MCCGTASRRRATSTSRSLLSLARASTPPLEDRTVTIPRSDDYESDDEHDMEMDEHDMGDGDTADEGAENDQRLPNVTLSNASTSSTPTLTSTSTFPTSREAQLNALYNKLQVATTIGNMNGNGGADDTTPTTSAVHVSGLFRSQVKNFETFFGPDFFKTPTFL